MCSELLLLLLKSFELLDLFLFFSGALTIADACLNTASPLKCVVRIGCGVLRHLTVAAPLTWRPVDPIARCEEETMGARSSRFFFVCLSVSHSFT